MSQLFASLSPTFSPFNRKASSSGSRTPVISQSQSEDEVEYFSMDEQDQVLVVTWYDEDGVCRECELPSDTRLIGVEGLGIGEKQGQIKIVDLLGKSSDGKLVMMMDSTPKRRSTESLPTTISRHSENLDFSLITFNSPSILTYTDHSRSITTQLDLDEYIGNVDGRFSIHSDSFSRVASNVRLTKEGWLFAELICEDEVWTEDTIFLKESLELVNGVLKLNIEKLEKSQRETTTRDKPPTRQKTLPLPPTPSPSLPPPVSVSEPKPEPVLIPIPDVPTSDNRELKKKDNEGEVIEAGKKELETKPPKDVNEKEVQEEKEKVEQIEKSPEESKESELLDWSIAALASASVVTYFFKSSHLQLDLDEFVGNVNGRFSSSAKGFSKSAKNVLLSADGWLEADLKCDDGSWRKDRVELKKAMRIGRGQLGIDTTKFELYEPIKTPPIVVNVSEKTEITSWSSIQLVSGSTITYVHELKELRLDLNDYLANIDGKLCEGKGFSHLARNFKLVRGDWLEGELRDDKGHWKWSGTCLKTSLKIKNDSLTVDTSELLSRTVSTTIPFSHVNIHASVLTYSFHGHEIKVNLDEYLSNVHGNFEPGRGFFKNSRHLRLDEWGWLHAELKVHGKQEGWKEAKIWIGEMFEVENGKLKFKPHALQPHSLFSLSHSSSSLSLTSNTLVSFIYGAHKLSVDLDHHFANVGGELEAGSGFSKAARDFRLDGWWLRFALNQQGSGKAGEEWVEGRIDLREGLKVRSGCLVVETETILKTWFICVNWSLVNLTHSTITIHHNSKDHHIDLDSFIGNSNGILQWKKHGGFFKTCRHVTLTLTEKGKLEGDLLKDDGKTWVRSSINLRDVIVIKHGKIFVGETKFEDDAVIATGSQPETPSPSKADIKDVVAIELPVPTKKETPPEPAHIGEKVPAVLVHNASGSHTRDISSLSDTTSENGSSSRSEGVSTSPASPATTWTPIDSIGSLKHSNADVPPQHLESYTRSCFNIRLEDGGVLTADHVSTNHKSQKVHIALNGCLGNVDGVLTWGKTGFLRTAKHVALSEDKEWLTCELSTDDGSGWKHSSIKLSDWIGVVSGKFHLMYNNETQTEPSPETHPAHISKHSYLHTCTSILLSSTILSCVHTENTTTSDVKVDLNRCISNINGVMRWTENNGGFADSARNIRIDQKGEWLFAELQMDNGEWREDKISLAHGLGVVGGMLKVISKPTSGFYLTYLGGTSSPSPIVYSLPPSANVFSPTGYLLKTSHSPTSKEVLPPCHGISASANKKVGGSTVSLQEFLSHHKGKVVFSLSKRALAPRETK